MTNAAARTRNLARVLERVLEGGTLTRGDLVDQTGLSKASVARLVAELEQAGLVEGRGIDPAAGPGRKSTGLGVPSSFGHVLGFSLGLRSSHVVALDLSGRTLGTRLEMTPAFTSGEEARAWVVEFLSRFESSLKAGGAPLRVRIALPGRVRDGALLAPLASPLAGLTTGESGSAPEPATANSGTAGATRSAEVAGPPEFAAVAQSGVEGSSIGDVIESERIVVDRVPDALVAAIGARLAAPVDLVTDADMALAGSRALGRVRPDASAVLFTLSTALTVATSTRAGTLQPRTAAFGDYASLPLIVSGDPLAANLTFGSVLSARGISDFASSRGIELSRIEDLWLSEKPEIVRVRQLFREALEAAILVAVTTTDPEVCVITGRLAPLVAVVLPELRAGLAARLTEVPELVVPGKDDKGLTTALGSAHSALAIERTRFANRVRTGELLG